jgi:hypothetical protein
MQSRRPVSCFGIATSHDGSSGWDPNSGTQIGSGWDEFKYLFYGGEGIIYAVKPTGELLWYQDLKRDGTNGPNGQTGWAPGSGNQIGVGWDGFDHVFSGDDGVIYAIKPTGELLWYQDVNRNGTNGPRGEAGWDPKSGNQIGFGWRFGLVFGGWRHHLCSSPWRGTPLVSRSEARRDQWCGWLHRLGRWVG